MPGREAVTEPCFCFSEGEDPGAHTGGCRASVLMAATVAVRRKAVAANSKPHRVRTHPEHYKCETKHRMRTYSQMQPEVKHSLMEVE